MKYNTLTEQTYFILLSLALEPLHGYGIMKKVETLSENRITLAAGTLYGAIDNLKKIKFIEQVENQNDSKRKVYRLTELGMNLLCNDFQNLQQRYLISKQILEKGD